MRLLHTSDWHLGQKLYDKERFEEFQNFLDWLIKVIIDQKIDLLIVAGDIFDVANPPQKAIEQYYRFLAKLVKDTSCQHAVIIGGNHDSIHSLNAPQELLKFLKLHIVGGATTNIEDEIIEIYDSNQNLQAVVAAVPFLRDKDIFYNHLQEPSTRSKAIIEAIQKHYQQIANFVEQNGYTQLDIPIIATGHLFAQGAQHHSDESQEIKKAEKDIYVGNLGKVPAEIFPTTFDYIALGHIHRSQIVGGKPHIRYAGSPIPLSFNEGKDTKSVLIVDFEGKKIKNFHELQVPENLYRKLIRVEGSLQEICRKIDSILYKNTSFKKAWLEVICHLDMPKPNFAQEIEKAIANNRHLESIALIPLYKENYKSNQWTEIFAEQDWKSISPETIFKLKCKQAGCSAETTQTLTELFHQILETLENEKP